MNTIPVSEIAVLDAQGNSHRFAEYMGKATLVVNVASKCGFTPQYKGLEALWQQYGAQGLKVVGFPCNQFGGQEPGSDEEIQQFCSLTYQVSFPVLGKIEVNGAHTAPLYSWLKSQAPGVLGMESVKWNFTKFLITEGGAHVERFAPQTDPWAMEKQIQDALKPVGQ
jgi:glutathione peroxidase